MRADMISSRRLIPAGHVQPSISVMIGERTPLSVVMIPVTTRGTFHGAVPGCHAAPPPPPPQPALVIRDGLSKSHPVVELAKAIQAHVEAMAKGVETMYDGGTPPVDVSTPQHEHARLTAKKTYLEEKLDAHRRAMHPEDHPDVAHRTRVLGQVKQHLSNLESQGVTSGPDHHYDWMQHYSKQNKLPDSDVNTALHAHMGVLASPQAKTMRRDVEGTHSGGHGMAPMPTLTRQQYLRLGGTQDELDKYNSNKPTKVTAVAKPPASTEERTASRLATKSVPLVVSISKAKGEDWISEKIRLLMHEGKPQKQAIAIAYSMAGRSKKDKAEKSIRLYVIQ